MVAELSTEGDDLNVGFLESAVSDCFPLLWGTAQEDHFCLNPPQMLRGSAHWLGADEN